MTFNTNQAPQFQPKPLEADKILTNPDEYQRDLLGNVAGVMQQTNAANAAATFDALSVSAKHLSKSDPKNSEIWSKYGEEIEALANSPAVSPQLRASKEFWDKSVKVIQAEHLDEIVEARAQARLADMRPSVESGNYNSAPSADGSPSAMDKLRETQWGKQLLDKYGERGVMRNVERMGVTLEKYAQMAAETNVVVNPNNPSEWWNRDLTRKVNNG